MSQATQAGEANLEHYCRFLGHYLEDSTAFGASRLAHDAASAVSLSSCHVALVGTLLLALHVSAIGIAVIKRQCAHRDEKPEVRFAAMQRDVAQSGGEQRIDAVNDSDHRLGLHVQVDASKLWDTEPRRRDMCYACHRIGAKVCVRS